MQIFFLIILFVFWLLFWSFASVIIYRLKSWEWWIIAWRSHCGSCNKLLQALDLIPLFSWIFNKWKCRQCKAKVSWLYPLLETTTATIFTLIWYFLIDINLLINLEIWEIVKLILWLIIWFISIIYIFYDILFLEISEIVLATWVFFVALWVIIQSYTSISIFSNLPNWLDSNLTETNYSILLLIIMIAWFYTIILKWLSSLWDSLILFWLFILLYLFNCKFTNEIYLTDYTAISAIIWAISVFTFFFIQYIIWDILHYLEKKKWIKEKYWKFKDWIIGWWDFRIAIMAWLWLWASLVFPAMMLTYFVWSVIWVGFIIFQKIKNKNKDTAFTQIPFWPFIAIWFFIAIFFQEKILDFMDLYLFI